MREEPFSVYTAIGMLGGGGKPDGVPRGRRAPSDGVMAAPWETTPPEAWGESETAAYALEGVRSDIEALKRLVAESKKKAPSVDHRSMPRTKFEASTPERKQRARVRRESFGKMVRQALEAFRPRERDLSGVALSIALEPILRRMARVLRLPGEAAGRQVWEGKHWRLLAYGQLVELGVRLRPVLADISRRVPKGELRTALDDFVSILPATPADIVANGELTNARRGERGIVRRLDGIAARLVSGGLPLPDTKLVDAYHRDLRRMTLMEAKRLMIIWGDGSNFHKEDGTPLPRKDRSIAEQRAARRSSYRQALREAEAKYGLEGKFLLGTGPHTTYAPEPISRLPGPVAGAKTLRQRLDVLAQPLEAQADGVAPNPAIRSLLSRLGTGWTTTASRARLALVRALRALRPPLRERRFRGSSGRSLAPASAR